MHSQIEKPKEMAQEECPMYTIGFCKNGPLCHFLHIKKDHYVKEEILSDIKNALKSLEDNPNQTITINGVNCSDAKCVNATVKFEMTVPSAAEITTPKLGNLLMPLVNDMKSISDSATDLNNLYNSDACAVLFKDD